MKQYCRYCANAILQGDDVVYCEPKDEMRDKKNCITSNECKKFELNPLDVFDIDKEYKPRKAYKPRRQQIAESGQIELEVTNEKPGETV
jgi:hypothetical protein